MLQSLPLQPWKSRLGAQRDWFWRGWRIRYTFIRPAHVESSDAVPILFVHGFGSALTQWHANLAPLSDYHPVYALDLLGFGTSEKASADYSASLWAEQIHDFWATFIRRPMILVGHSLGALVAATTTVTYPDLVRGLAIITLPATRQEVLPTRWIQPVVGAVERVFASPLLIRFIFQIARRPKIIRSALNLAYVDRRYVTDDLVASIVRPTCDRGAAQTLCRLSRAATRLDYSPSRQTLLSTIYQPVLLLWGQQDRVIPIAQAESLVSLNPRIRLVELPDAGHCPYDEQYERVNSELLNWIATGLTCQDTTET
ncbi:MAG: alpha/beta fold hydrolase [Elainellaceae cyanobacterium]